MPDSAYTVTIRLRNVAEGDVTDLAQRIWDEHAADLDASQGDFKLDISCGGFPVDWAPPDS
jgi:hypothetical protein